MNVANRLKMAINETIITLWQRGWSQRRIADELCIDRETVSRYVGLAEAESKPAKAPPGSDECSGGSKPAKAPPRLVAGRG